jgi:exodeoxyribonuclease VII large subunit
LRGRHLAEVESDLERTGRGSIARRLRAFQTLQLRLESLNIRRHLGRVQTRITQADATLRAAIVARCHAARRRLGSAAARIDALSPLAVLGRGYAVCWDGAKQTILRDAAAVADGSTVRVTLHRGELDCTVRGRSFDKPEPHASPPVGAEARTPPPLGAEARRAKAAESRVSPPSGAEARRAKAAESRSDRQ